MASLLDAVLDFDTALRAYERRVGGSPATRALAQAGIQLRRAVAIQALAAEAATPDPKADLRRVLQAAIDAGLGWHEVVAVVNTMHEGTPR